MPEGDILNTCQQREKKIPKELSQRSQPNLTGITGISSGGVGEPSTNLKTFPSGRAL